MNDPIYSILEFFSQPIVLIALCVAIISTVLFAFRKTLFSFLSVSLGFASSAAGKARELGTRAAPSLSAAKDQASYLVNKTAPNSKTLGRELLQGPKMIFGLNDKFLFPQIIRTLYVFCIIGGFIVLIGWLHWDLHNWHRFTEFGDKARYCLVWWIIYCVLILAVRIWAEFAILFFSIYERLVEIRNALKPGTE